MITPSWCRWVCALAVAAWFSGCSGASSIESDAGVLTKGHGGTPGATGAGGVVGMGGTAGASGPGGAGGAQGPLPDGGAMDASPADGASDGGEGSGEDGGDARHDVEPPRDTAAETKADATMDGNPVDAPTVDATMVDAPIVDVVPPDALDDADTTNCPARTSAWFGPHAARSSGYAGTLSDYGDLYDVVCTSLQACKDSCVAAGGTPDSCMAGSQCASGAGDVGKHCLPPTYWRYGDRALDESADWTEAAEQTLVVIDYNDPLVVRDFRVNVPAGATILGIQFEVHRSADEDSAIDDSIRILRDGQPVGIDHKKSDAWPADLTYVTYGGPNDTWGVTWSPDDIESAGFGIAIAAQYTQTAGNARAYVDYVRVRVHFTPRTCN